MSYCTGMVMYFMFESLDQSLAMVLAFFTKMTHFCFTETAVGIRSLFARIEVNLTHNLIESRSLCHNRHFLAKHYLH